MARALHACVRAYACLRACVRACVHCLRGVCIACVACVSCTQQQVAQERQALGLAFSESLKNAKKKKPVKKRAGQGIDTELPVVFKNDEGLYVCVCDRAPSAASITCVCVSAGHRTDWINNSWTDGRADRRTGRRLSGRTCATMPTLLPPPPSPTNNNTTPPPTPPQNRSEINGNVQALDLSFNELGGAGLAATVLPLATLQPGGLAPGGETVGLSFLGLARVGASEDDKAAAAAAAAKALPQLQLSL
jgi:hypothetical protein